ncbi:MAG: RNA methyltransferase [Desulfarculaceae bacterium]|nr:RNA methyltransferase [Desulfarculaceae bacterium]MCF8073582.1 RNA methyltransferase [Desulfarculaceae bacterium]MCF8103739.1 RNA methyltransferase [Desulfarculaceae bacterium]MCF8115702.1 RNA methyltransferase [Desulfarculaceae bacterium]
MPRSKKIDLTPVVVVLVRPRFPENIGAAARVVANMGLGGLRVVEPERPWDEPMKRLASTCGRKVLASMESYPSLRAALADTVGAAATTARVGYKRGELTSPRRAAPELLGWAQGGKAAIVFGPEDRGLTTSQLDRCQLSVCIPTDQASSLNLAQAVMVMAYELRQTALEAGSAPASGPSPASHGEMMGLHRHLIDGLVAIGTLKEDNPEHFYRPIKNVIERGRPSSREVRAMRGIARQMLWAAGRIQEHEAKK